MESQVLFRDYQEQQAQDHNDLQEFARRSFDHLTLDAVTADRRYAGFNITKTGQTEVQIEPGRMYDVLGAIYALNTTTVQSMTAYLASAYKRWVLVTAVGSDVETDIEERDFIIDANTGATEPRAIATTRSRTAVLTFTAGTESGDPIIPAVPVGHVAIGYILLDPTQIVSVLMEERNKVTSTDNLDLRADDLETFAAIIGPKVSALAADLADLKNKLAEMGSNRLLLAVAQDLARVKAKLQFTVANAVDYQTDYFLDTHYIDADNSMSLGNDCLIEEGLRFGYANMDEFEISLFSANDPNASFANGVLLPKYTEILRLATTQQISPDSTLGIAQYGYQTVANKLGYMSRSRLRYGDSFWACSNSMRWNATDPMGSAQYLAAAYFNPISQLYDTQSGMTSTRLTALGAQIYGPPEAGGNITGMAYELSRYDSFWFDQWNEPFIYSVTTDSNINGAFVAQTFLVPNDIWATSIRVYISAKGANEDINLLIAEVNAGVPDLERTMVKVAYPQASIVTGWNSIPIPATFLQKGRKYAVCLISNANHQIGMVSGQKYLDGTFFYSTDGIYYQGDLTKDLMLQVWGAYFNNSQVTIEFAPINLDGGFRNVDILAAMWVPNSAHVYFEVRPNGTGEWQPLTHDNSGVLSVAPPLAQFRVRFDGSRDMHGAITLTGSRVRVWRPKTAFKAVSEMFTVTGACATVKVTCVLEHFDDTPHDHTCVLRTGATHNVLENPDTTVTKLTDAAAKRYEREYTFSGLSPTITQFLVEQSGTTNSAQNTFHVAERTFIAIT